jgi:hypothetical protein
LFENQIGDLYQDLTLAPMLLSNWENNIYLTLRSGWSLNNLENSEMKISENIKWTS